jgi:hypothetical protein
MGISQFKEAKSFLLLNLLGDSWFNDELLSLTPPPRSNWSKFSGSSIKGSHPIENFGITFYTTVVKG